MSTACTISDSSYSIPSKTATPPSRLQKVKPSLSTISSPLHSSNENKEITTKRKTQQNTNQKEKKIQTKEKQLKKKEQDLARTEIQQKELYEQNRLLKEYCQSLELRMNDLEEQNKELKLKLLTSENLRNTTTKKHPEQRDQQDLNQSILTLLTTSMATISSNMLALQNQVNQSNHGNQSQKPNIKITNICTRDNSPKKSSNNIRRGSTGGVTRQDDVWRRGDWRRREGEGGPDDDNWRQQRTDNSGMGRSEGCWRQREREHGENRACIPNKDDSSQHNKIIQQTDQQTGKPANQETSKPGNQQTSEPGNQQTCKAKESVNLQQSERSDDFLGASKSPKAPDKPIERS